MVSHKQRFHANGKLLLSGEYAVLDGALALAVPARAGQSMEVCYGKHAANIAFEWTALQYSGEIWINSKFSVKNGKIVYLEGSDNLPMLLDLLQVLHQKKPEIFNGLRSVVTQLEFPHSWGFGSSSTLISLLAQWSQTDPFALLAETTGGSGYDIACATAHSPIQYQLSHGKPIVERASISQHLLPYLRFVFLNKKKNSREAITQYRQKESSPQFVNSISQISCEMQQCHSVSDFQALMKTHESLIASQLSLETVQHQLFPDLKGAAVKSLGAWGGDFVMVCAEKEIETYFIERGYTTILHAEDFYFQ